MGETIESAAILRDGVVWSVPRPGRHIDVFYLMKMSGIEESHGDTQGFVTSTGRFVRREPALKIARRAKQLVKELPINPRQLFSEDVW